MRVNLELENNMVWYVRAAGAHSEPVSQKYLGWFRWQGQIGTELGAGRKKDGASKLGRWERLGLKLGGI